jgi:hypothetical protein
MLMHFKIHCLTHTYTYVNAVLGITMAENQNCITTFGGSSLFQYLILRKCVQQQVLILET